MRVGTPGIAPPTLRLTTPANANRPTWVPGQTLLATVRSSQGGLVRLAIGQLELLAEWPGQTPRPAETVRLQIIGRQDNVWQMAVLNEEATAPAVSLPQLLQQLGVPLNRANLEQLHRYLQGEGGTDWVAQPAETGGTLFPVNGEAWQQLLGYVPELAPLFLAMQPMPCGLFVAERQADQTASGPARSACWLLAVDLPTLGPVRVVGTGSWPEQELMVVAGAQTLPMLQRSEPELRRLLAGLGMQLQQLSFTVAETPLVQLPAVADLYVAGVDLKL